MCGRYTLSTPIRTLADEFDIAGSLPELKSSYNVAPSQEVAAVGRAVMVEGTPLGDA